MKTNKGFTLIELLVVIAIIGVLASVVLASLSSARTKGNDAKIQSQLSGMRSQALLYTGTGTGFSLATCAATAATLFATTAGENNLGNLFPSTTFTNSACYAAAGLPSNGAAWAVAWPLSSGWFCVDSAGAARTKTSGGTAYTGASGASPAAITTASCN